MYTKDDVSIVIPTYNRLEYLAKNLSNLQGVNPFEIIVVDQSKDTQSKGVCLIAQELLPNLKYIHTDVPSTARAKNLGWKSSSPKTSIVLFLDDDAYLLPGYLDRILEVYNNFPDASGVKSFDFGLFEKYQKWSVFKRIAFEIEHLIKKMFLLGNSLAKEPIINSPYGNSNPMFIDKTIKAQWFPGTDQSFKKEALKKVCFDDNLIGWSLIEDIDICYRMTKTGYTLYYTPFAKLVHDHPEKELADKQIVKRAYINNVMHYYFYKKNTPNWSMRYFINIVGIFGLRLIRMLSLKKKHAKEFYYFIKSLSYTFKNRKKIERGEIVIP
jgi:GT2 family glycosyltransferase